MAQGYVDIRLLDNLEVNAAIEAAVQVVNAAETAPGIFGKSVVQTSLLERLEGALQALMSQAADIEEAQDVQTGEHHESEVDRLRAALVECHAALLWCGGSNDFQPEGIAAQGWRNVVIPVLKQADEALGNLPWPEDNSTT
jgi:hypothetical protein